jgi:hypothetical protein
MTSRGTWIGLGTVLAVASVALVGWSVSRAGPDDDAVTRQPLAPVEQRGVEPAPLEAPDKPAPSKPASTETTRAPAMAEDSELAEAIWVEGRVLLPAGTPSDERIEVVAKGKRFETVEHHSAMLETDGSFRVAFHPEAKRGRLTLKARYAHLPMPRRLNFLKLPKPLAPVTLRPVLGAWVTGVLLPPANLRDDDPWPESITVVLSFGGENRADGRSRTKHVTLDEDTFSFDFGAIPVVPKGRGYDVFARRSAWQKQTAQGRTLEVAEHRHIEVPMQLGAQILGRVVDESNKGVEALVKVTSAPSAATAGDTTSSMNVTSAEDGRFTAYGIPPGRVAAAVRAKGYTRVALEFGILDDGERVTDATLHVERGLSISGTVLWPDGTPASGAKVKLGAQEVSPVEADGQFVFTGLGPGTVRIDASAPSRTLRGEPAAEAAASMPWRSGAEVETGTSNIVLVLTPGATLRGNVSDEDGRPVNNFSISLRPGGTWSGSRNEMYFDAHGGFSMDGLQDGDWLISARGTEHSTGPSVRFTVAGKDARVDLTSFNQSGLSGTIVDDEGLPVPKVYVNATVDGRAHGLAGTQSLAASTSKDGTFEIYRLRPGSVELLIQKKGYLETHLSGLTLLPGELRSEIRIELRGDGRIEGFVRGFAAGSSARVRLKPTRSDYHDSVKVEADGSFAFARVAADTYQVELQVEGLPKTAVETNVFEGETAHVALEVSTSGLVRVHGVVSRRSEGLPDVEVSANGETSATVRSDANGRYELFVVPGNFLVLVNEPDNTTEREVEIPQGAEFRLDLELPTGSLGGHVVRENGKPETGVRIELAGDWMTLDTTIFGSEFRFDDLGPGKYRIEATMALNSVQRYVSAPTFVELGQNQSLDGIALVLKKPGRIVGHVADDAGLPVVGEAVLARATGDESGRWKRAKSDSAGRFQFKDLGPAEWIIATFKDSKVSASSTVVLVAGDEARVDLVVTP